MRRTLFYLITLTLFAIVRVNGHAQEISDFDFDYFSSNTSQGEHIFRWTNVASSGGTFCPNINTTRFGIIHHENGITPYDVNKEMLLNALQYNICTFTGDHVGIPEFFPYYDLGSSTFKNLEFLGIKIDGDIEPVEDLFSKEYIFCWITNGILWYEYVTITSYHYDNENANPIHFYVNFTWDVHCNPYGICHYDL